MLALSARYLAALVAALLTLGALRGLVSRAPGLLALLLAVGLLVRLLGHLHGVECLTVPADEGETLLAGTPFYVAREAAALAFYFLRG